jgi:hypothetical protein
MPLQIPDISRFILNDIVTIQLTDEELAQLSYSELYKLHGEITKRKLDAGYPKQIAFGNLSLDAKPNRNGEAEIHFAPLPSSTRSERDFNYKLSDPLDFLKISLIGLEDIISLIQYIQSGINPNIPKRIIGKTNSKLAEIAVKLGFEYVQEKDDDSLHGIIRKVAVDVEKLLQQLPGFEYRLALLQRKAARKGITPQMIRTEIIKDSSTTTKK